MIGLGCIAFSHIFFRFFSVPITVSVFSIKDLIVIEHNGVHYITFAQFAEISLACRGKYERNKFDLDREYKQNFGELLLHIKQHNSKWWGSYFKLASDLGFSFPKEKFPVIKRKGCRINSQYYISVDDTLAIFSDVENFTFKKFFKKRDHLINLIEKLNKYASFKVVIPHYEEDQDEIAAEPIFMDLCSDDDEEEIVPAEIVPAEIIPAEIIPAEIIPLKRKASEELDAKIIAIDQEGLDEELGEIDLEFDCDIHMKATKVFQQSDDGYFECLECHQHFPICGNDGPLPRDFEFSLLNKLLSAIGEAQYMQVK